MTQALSPDTRRGHYRLLSLLGEGGMGAVYLAEDTQLGRRVALKILPVDSGDAAKRRFIREARAVAALDHPNICTVHEVGEDGGQSYIVMQYVEGRTVASWLNDGELRLERSLDYAIQVCEALQEAHDHGIVHRDVKPSNVMVSNSGQVKVLDFGLAKILDQQTEHTDLLTRPGVVPGTRPYMSPEQLRGERLDPRSDIFSFGVMLYEMLTGRRPFDSTSTEATITAILFFDPPKIESTSPVLLKIEPIIRKALQKDPDRRYRRIGDLADDLMKIRADLSSEMTIERRSVGNRELTDSLVPVTPRRRKPAFDSIAVIPRVSSKTDPEFTYLREGIAESIIEQLSRTPRLRVLARSTAFRFQEADLDLQALRSNLNVSSIATVNMSVQGQRLEVTIQMTGTEKGDSLMTREYSGSIDTPYRLAEDAARDVLAILRPAAARKRRTSTHAADPQAYQLFLKARFQWNKRSPDGIKQAIELYQQATGIDPMFPAPYVGLADAYNLLGFLAVMPPRLVYPKAKAAAKRAIELDPSAGEAYASLGYAAGQYDWNFPEAIRLHGEAIQRNPSYAWAYHWRGLTAFMPLAQFDDALGSVRQAEGLDPLTPIMGVGVGVVLFFARRYEEARGILEHIREIEPKFMAVHSWLGMTYEQLQRYDEALASFKTTHELAPSNLSSAMMCHCYAVAGRTEEAHKLLAETMQRADRSYVTPYTPLMTYIGLGDEQRALESLKLAIEERSPWLYLAGVDPRFDRVRAWLGSGLENLIKEHMLQT